MLKLISCHYCEYIGARLHWHVRIYLLSWLFCTASIGIDTDLPSTMVVQLTCGWRRINSKMSLLAYTYQSSVWLWLALHCHVTHSFRLWAPAKQLKSIIIDITGWSTYAKDNFCNLPVVFPQIYPRSRASFMQCFTVLKRPYARARTF